MGSPNTQLGALMSGFPLLFRTRDSILAEMFSLGRGKSAAGKSPGWQQGWRCVSQHLMAWHKMSHCCASQRGMSQHRVS